MSLQAGSRRKEVRLILAAMCFLVVAATALRVYRLDSGLWFDEIATLTRSVRPPLAEILTRYDGDNDHKLYSVLAHVSVAAFGEHAWSLRLPAALFGIASIPLIYLLGAAVTTRLEGLLAAAILTVSYHHVWFSQNARAYTMLLFAALLSTLLLVRWLEGGKRWNLWLYAPVLALGAYAHMTMILVGISHAVICAMVLFSDRTGTDRSGDRVHVAGAFAGAGALTLLLYGPALGDVYRTFSGGSAPTAASGIATPLWALWAAIDSLQIGFGALWVLAAGAFVVCCGAWSYLREKPVVLSFFLLPPAVTLLALILMGRPVRPRFVFFAMGFGVLIALRGAGAIGRWAGERAGAGALARHGTAAAVCLIGAGAVVFSAFSLPFLYRYPKQDYVEAVSFVERNKKEGDLAAAVGITAALPVVDFMGRPWDRIDHGYQLDELRSTGKETWVVYTFSEYIEADDPGLWHALIGDCEEAKLFEGTVGGGAIHVGRCPPA